MQVSTEDLLPGVHDLDAFLTRGHKAVLGKSGSGKSVLLDSWVDGTSLAVVFVNPHRVPMKARLAKTPHDVLALLRAGVKRIQWQPPREHEVKGGKAVILAQYGALVAKLFGVGRRLFKGDKAPPWLLLVTDECQLFCSKTGSIGPLEMVLTEGRKFGIVAVNASQRPARVSLEVFGQADVKVVFKLDPEDVDYLRDRKYPVDEFMPWVRARPYRFVLLDAESWVPYRPLKR